MSTNGLLLITSCVKSVYSLIVPMRAVTNLCFIIQVSAWYTLVIFTASMKEYADPVIDWLDAGRGMFGSRFFREVRIPCVLGLGLNSHS